MNLIRKLSVLVIIWYLISGIINFYAGYSSVIIMGSTLAAIVAGIFGVCLQAMIPYFVFIRKYNDKKGFKTSYFNHAGVAIASFVTIFSFWLTLSNMATMQFADVIGNSYKLVASSEKIKATDFKIDNINIVDQVDVANLQKELGKIEGEITAIKNKKAYNLANVDTGHTVWEMTNGCTSGQYYTNSNLYKNDCLTLAELNNKATTIKTKIDETTRNQGETAASVNAKSELLITNANNKEHFGESFSKMISNSNMITYFTSDYDVKKCDEQCTIDYKNNFIKKLNIILLAVAITLFIVEYSMVESLLGIISPVKKGSNTVFENNIATSFTNDAIDVNKKIAGLSYTEIERLINFSDETTEIKALTLATCHLYSSGAKLPIKSTLDTIEIKLQNKEYCNNLLNEHCDSTSIKNICKNGRLQSKVFPLLDGVFIEKVGSSYFWKSEESLRSLLSSLY